MELTINYLLKSGLCLLALYLFYYGVLRNQPSFGLNRLNLLLAPAVALALPFMPWPALRATDVLVAEAFPSIQLQELVVTAYGSPNAASYKSLLTLPNIIAGTYIAVMLVLLFRLASQLLHVNSLISSGSRLPTAPADAILIQTQSTHPTFAFLHYIFVSERPHLSAPEKKQILAHELAHVKLLHTWDILYYEVLTALLWFNPMVWLLKNELRDVHEYQADAKVIAQHEAQQYSALLAKEVLFKTGVPVGSYFREPQIFKRLQMLQQYGKKTNLLRPLAVLPLLFLLTFFFSSQAVTADIASPLSGSQAEPVSEQTAVPAPATEGPAAAVSDNSEAKLVPPATPAAEETPEVANAAPTTMKVKPYSYVEQMPQFSGGEKAMLQFLGENIKYPEAAVAAKVEGMTVLSFVVLTDGTLTDIEVIKDLGYGTSEEAARVVELMNGQWEPGRQNGVALPVRYTLPIRYTIR